MRPAPRFRASRCRTPTSRLLLLGVAGVLLFGHGACVPPHGLGPLPLPGERETGLVSVSLEYGFAPDHHVVQLDAAMSVLIEDWVSLEAGVLYVALRDPGLYPWQAREPGQFKHSGLPYLRPSFHIGPVTISVPVSGFFAVGPEAGAAWGFGGLSVAYATHEWAVHAGVQGHGFFYLTEGKQPTGGSWQAVVGGQYAFDLEGPYVALTAEGVYGEQSFTLTGGSSGERHRSFVMVLFGLELGWSFD